MVKVLKENNVWVYACEAKGENIFSCNKDFSLPTAIVIGSEGFGVRQSLIAYCDGVLSLPLRGKVNSLNASVACGIVVFEIVRRRQV